VRRQDKRTQFQPTNCDAMVLEQMQNGGFAGKLSPKGINKAYKKRKSVNGV
jgi:hypothetical protein